jgi:hypothetical protein
MPPSKDHENLQLGDTILVETAVDEIPSCCAGAWWTGGRRCELR